MPSPKIDRQNFPAVVAHRGASASHPENTIDAFLAAVAAGADFIELDVRLTSDDALVVIHDFEVSRTTDGTGLVHEMTLAQVKDLDASGGTATGARVPTFQEVLGALTNGVGLDVEIKNLPGEPAFDSPKEALVERVLGSIRDSGFAGPLLVSSFNWLSIERARALAPDVPTGFITSAMIDPWAALVYARSHGHAFLLPQAGALLEAGPSFIDASHDAGVLVGAWTVDEPESVERLFAMGVDAVATNDPAMAIPIRDRFRSG
jgi:glycerophosphoryl diester phosphodiesterase